MSNAVETLAAVDLAAVQKGLTGPGWLSALRERARTRFEALDWPTTSEEEWRRTNLSPFEFDTYGLLSVEPSESGAQDKAPSDGWAGYLRYRNGVLEQSVIADSAREAGVTVADLSSVSDDSVESAVRRALTAHADSMDNRIVAWHLALLQDVAVVHVPDGVVLEHPVYVDVAVDGDEVMGSPHLVVIAGRNSEATVVRRITGAEEGEVLLVDGSDLVVADNARLTIVMAQFLNDESLYFSNDRGVVERDGFLRRTEAVLGADFVKARFACAMNGPGADAALNGIYFAADEQHMDIRTVQHHIAPKTTSRSYYRGAVRDESHAIYQGLIRVDGTAPGTDAYLTNKNLVLAEAARADSIPSLNIQIDDVRCSHGSTTGKLDPAQIFYLESRGFPKDEAKRILIQGFFDDLIASAPEAVAEQMRARIAERVPE